MRAYRILLRLFPASFRGEYGSEMESIFARRLGQASGVLPRLALWGEALADVLHNAVRVHADILAQDLRYTLRTLGRAPGFALTAILVGALGVGATTATFSITDHVLVRPLPFPEPGRLLKLWQEQPARGYSRMELSPANYRDWEAMTTSFEGMAAFTDISANVVGEGEPQRLEGTATTAGLFSVLGASPALGRDFTAADDREGAPATLVLSHGLWQTRFGGDPEVLGRTVVLDGEPAVIVGVMPRAFRFPTRESQFWRPIRFKEEDFEERDNCYLRAVARLKPDVSVERARAELKLVAARLERAYPKENALTGAGAVRLRDELSPQARLLLVALFGAALCVLLIACTNLASLLLSRALVRRRELAVRTALGAGRERLVRQLFTESLVLAVGGGALGVLLAVAAGPLVARLVPNSLPIAGVPELNLRVLAFAGLVTALTGVGFGVVPALRARRDVGASGLREGSRAGVGGGREVLRAALVLAEVTVSVVLLVSSGLLIRALWRLQAVPPGFRPENVLTVRTQLPLPKYEKTERRGQFYRTVLAEVRALPGVAGAGYISFLPMVMRGGIWGVEVPGHPEEPGAAESASLRFVTPGLFATLGIPLRRGRDVSESDTRDSALAAVVSASFVERYWAGEDPVGRQFKIAFHERTIVGVVGDIRVRGIERSSEPQVYLPYRQVEDGWLIGYTPKYLAVSAPVPPEMLLPSIRRIVKGADPEQAISDVRTLSEIVAGETAPREVQVRVLGAFAAIAVLLAGVGLHGLLAFAVSSRAQEIGVRMALGAGSREILSLVLRKSVGMAAGGVVLGLFLAYAAGRALEALLAGVSPRDPATFSAAAALAVFTALLGSLLPALRAVRVDPLAAIRAE
jgi:predicted permease